MLKFVNHGWTNDECQISNGVSASIFPFVIRHSSFNPSPSVVKSLVYFLGSSVNGLACTWNGLTIFTVPVNGRCAFFGSRHESEQTPPHPNSNVAVPQTEPSAFTSVSFGPAGRWLPRSIWMDSF
jgi:hypothetical protein